MLEDEKEARGIGSKRVRIVTGNVRDGVKVRVRVSRRVVQETLVWPSLHLDIGVCGVVDIALWEQAH